MAHVVNCISQRIKQIIRKYMIFLKFFNKMNGQKKKKKSMTIIILERKYGIGTSATIRPMGPVTRRGDESET